jgi:hypothetical protein
MVVKPPPIDTKLVPEKKDMNRDIMPDFESKISLRGYRILIKDRY